MLALQEQIHQNDEKNGGKIRRFSFTFILQRARSLIRNSLNGLHLRFFYSVGWFDFCTTKYTIYMWRMAYGRRRMIIRKADDIGVLGMLTLNRKLLLLDLPALILNQV